MAASHAHALTHPEPEDFVLWATGRAPRGPPRAPLPNIPRANEGDLVSQPFVQNVSSTGATGVSLFSDPANHPDAVGTILTHSAKLASFFPAKGLDNQQEQFGAYIEKVSTFPGFLLVYNEQTGQSQTSVNTDLMIKDIKNAYEGVIGADVNKVIDSINNMANSIKNKSTHRADKSVFTQMTITEDSGNLVATIFYTQLHMELETSGKKTYSSQSYYVNRSVFKCLSATLVANAAKLSELLGDGSFDDWAKDFSSPTGTKLSCFEKNHKAPREN
ncbi:hypothetical protein EMPS_11504 [Entomortierella parvispora]|uniref:Uncharacterized protein n=1 Tax=Entomortierella parvispora TaxID=205924 RepID=A0A9P3HM84_9FUNG|nr:hypothetical protein EMPS_11504 [Entomortierella parvispora]